MKNLINLSICILILTSCSNQSALHQLIQEADVVKIYITSGAAIPMIHYETNDIDKIQKWWDYIDEKSNVKNECNYEGKLIFKVYDDSTEMQFSLQNGCEQVSYKLNDTLFVKKLTPVGTSYLNSLIHIQ